MEKSMPSGQERRHSRDSRISRPSLWDTVDPRQRRNTTSDEQWNKTKHQATQSENDRTPSGWENLITNNNHRLRPNDHSINR